MHAANEVRTHTPAHKQQFFSLPSLFTHARTWISLGCFSAISKSWVIWKICAHSDFAAYSIYVYFAISPNFPSPQHWWRNSLAAGSHWAEQTNTRHQLMRSVNTAPYVDESIAVGEREYALLLLLSGISQIIHSHYWINASAVIGRVKFNWIPWWDIMDRAKTHRICADANMQLNMAIHSLDSNRPRWVCFQGL